MSDDSESQSVGSHELDAEPNALDLWAEALPLLAGARSRLVARDEPLAAQLRGLLKTLFDYGKSVEPTQFGALSELTAEGLGAEALWAQLELQNRAVARALRPHVRHAKDCESEADGALWRRGVPLPLLPVDVRTLARAVGPLADDSDASELSSLADDAELAPADDDDDDDGDDDDNDGDSDADADSEALGGYFYGDDDDGDAADDADDDDDDAFAGEDDFDPDEMAAFADEGEELAERQRRARGDADADDDMGERERALRGDDWNDENGAADDDDDASESDDLAQALARASGDQNDAASLMFEDFFGKGKKSKKRNRDDDDDDDDDDEEEDVDLFDGNDDFDENEFSDDGFGPARVEKNKRGQNEDEEEEDNEGSDEMRPEDLDVDDVVENSDEFANFDEFHRVDRVNRRDAANETEADGSAPRVAAAAPGDALSPFEQAQREMAARVAKMEDALVADRPWALRGEVGARKRPRDSLLGTEVEFEHATVPAPVVTDERTHTLEDMIRARVRDGAFDDVVRRTEAEVAAARAKRRALPELSHEKSKLSLAELYEQEYLAKRDAAAAAQLGDDGVDAEAQVAVGDELDEQRKEIRQLFDALCARLDALSHFRVRLPPSAVDEAQAEAGAPPAAVPAARLEHALPVAMAVGDALAPEERYKPARHAASDVVERAAGAVRRARKKAAAKKAAASGAPSRAEAAAARGGKEGHAAALKAVLSAGNTSLAEPTSGKKAALATADSERGSTALFKQLQREVSGELASEKRQRAERDKSRKQKRSGRGASFKL